MRTIRDIAIIKAIVHKLDNGQNTPTLSDFQLGIENDERVREFVKTHILSCVKDENLKKAGFNGETNIVKDNSIGIFSDENTFIINSKQIARELFRAMQSNRNISSADIIIAQFIANRQSFLTILKLDYQSTYIAEAIQEGNLIKIVITERGISLPNKRQKLQKAVFIREPNQEGQCDLMLLDKQTRDDEVARYFSNNFLNCSILLDDLRRTKDLYKAVNKWAREERENPEETRRVLDRMRNAFDTQNSINLAQFAEELFEEERQRDEFLNYLSRAGVTDFNFNIHREWVSNNLKKRTIRLTDGIKIDIDNRVYNNPDKFSMDQKENGLYDIFIRDVKVTDWD